MTELPDFLAEGEEARLIPVVADSSREKRLASVLLAGAIGVPDFAHSLFAGFGQRVGTRTRICAFTEVRPREMPSGMKDRPDGLVMISTGHRTWSAFVEAKIGNRQLEAEQVERYIDLAKANGVDAVVTISNEFTARPEHSPVRFSRKPTKKVDLYHLSWMSVLTKAKLLQMDETVEDRDQAFLLNELVRFFDHESAGIEGFSRMDKGWKEIVQTVRNGGALNKRSEDVERAVASWHQEERDLCLIMAQHLGRAVRLKLERKFRDAPLDRLKDDCERLAEERILESVLQIPDAAADIRVCADLRTRTVNCSMRLEAPKDKRSTKARVNWLLRQISKANDPDIHIRACWPSRTSDTMDTLTSVRADPGVLQTDNPKQAPSYLEVMLVRDIAGKFAGSQTFIQHLEEAVPRFYDQVGQHIRAWQASPPKPRVQPQGPETEQEAEASEATWSPAASTPPSGFVIR